MSHRLVRIFDELESRSLMEAVEAFIDAEYTRENVAARRAYVFDFGTSEIDSRAFAIHYPGSPETADLPGYAMDELPEPLRQATRIACDEMGLTGGRVFFNVGRYIAHAGELPPHFDGELFDYSVLPDNSGMQVRSGIRPSHVSVLTLKNDTCDGGTLIVSESGESSVVDARPGELLCFDNLTTKHGVPDMAAVAEDPEGDSPGEGAWVRYIVGWRAFEDRCFRWSDGQPLEPLTLAEAASLHRRFLAEQWPSQIAAELSRGRL